MGDWIDAEKAADKEVAAARAVQAQLRLHDAGIIRASLPAFFASFAAVAKEQAGKLQREYPHDLSKQCGASGDGNPAVTLQGCKLPIRVLNLRLNLAGQCIEIDESTRVSRDRIVPVGFDKIQIKVNDEEEL